MNPIRVYIATTSGLVAVQRITEEDPEVNSVVCLAGKAVALPISAAYEAFVRDPTGVVQRHFGHPAYRVDVSASVDEGYSWQLGLFAAHALVKADRLAHPDATDTPALIATGEVNRDLHVLAVDRLQEKFGDFAAQLDAIGAAPKDTVLAVPKDNAEAVDGLLGESGAAIRTLALAEAGELLNDLGVPLVSRAAKAEPAAEVQAPRRASRAGPIALLIALIAAGAGATGVTYSPQLKEWAAQWVPALGEPEPAAQALPGSPPAKQAAVEPLVPPAPPKPVPTAPPASSEPVPKIEPLPLPKSADPNVPPATAQPTPEPVKAETEPVTDVLGPRPKPARKDADETARLRPLPKRPVQVQILELRAPPGSTCRDVRAGDVEPATQVAPAKGPFAFGPSIMENLCTVEIRATANVDGLYLFGRYQRWTQGKPGQTPPDKVIDLGPRLGSVHWSVDIPERMDRGASFQIVVFSSWNDFRVPKKLLSRIGTQPRSPEARRAVKRLKKRGIAMTATRFRVVPEKRLNRLRERQNQSRLGNSGG